MPEIPKDQTLTLEQLVDFYLHKKISNKEGDLLSHKEHLEKFLSSLEDLTAYICGLNNVEKVPNVKKYVLNGHQKRPLNGKPHIINKMGENLENIDKEKFDNFEELIDYVEARREKFFGPTAIYDFALRYGWNREERIEPEKYVYVHAIPEDSAKILKELGYLKTVTRRIPITDFPKEMRQPGMTAKDIENFLCVFHDEILKLKG